MCLFVFTSQKSRPIIMCYLCVIIIIVFIIVHNYAWIVNRWIMIVGLYVVNYTNPVVKGLNRKQVSPSCASKIAIRNLLFFYFCAFLGIGMRRHMIPMVN